MAPHFSIHDNTSRETVTVSIKHTYHGSLYSVKTSNTYSEFTYDGILQYLVILAEILENNGNHEIDVKTNMGLSNQRIPRYGNSLQTAFENYVNLLSSTVNSYQYY